MNTAAKDVLRIYHGAVDQATITTRPTPEVIKRICQVLEDLGMALRAESEYKYKCVCAKRKLLGLLGSGSAVWLVRMGWRRLRC